MDLACLLLEVCLRSDQSHGNGVILPHMQTLFVSTELAEFITGNLVTHLSWSIILQQTNKIDT